MKQLLIRLSQFKHKALKQMALDKDMSMADLVRKAIDTLGSEFSNEVLNQMNNDGWRTYIKKRDDYKCNKCGMQGAEETTYAHHIMPRKEGGKNTLENGMTLCRSCHKKIHATLQFPIP